MRIRCAVADAPTPGELWQTGRGRGLVRAVSDVESGVVEVTVELPAEEIDASGAGGPGRGA